MTYSLIYITASDIKEARFIARDLLEKRLVACVNIVPGVESHYWWGGKICEGTEALIFAKTTESKARDVILEVKEIHSYKIPAISVFNISGGNMEFMDWIEKETGDLG